MLVSSPAWAGSSTVGVTAGSGTNVSVTTDGSSNVFWRNTIWDYSAGANGASVDAGHNLFTNMGEMGGTAINSGCVSNYGTSPGAVACPSVNAFVTNANAPSPTTTGGLTTFFLQPAASDNHTVVKNGAGQVYFVLAENNSATVNYLRFYNAGTGFNGCNAATNLVSQIQIPASTSVGGISIPLPFGISFATGISICVTSGYATNDTTNATATAISLTIGYN